MANPPSWDAQPSAPKVKTTKPENIYENVRSPSKETKPERTDSTVRLRQKPIILLLNLFRLSTLKFNINCLNLFPDQNGSDNNSNAEENR